MRKRAKPATAPAPTSAAPPAPPESEPKKPTKYDQLVDVLADGLFEMIMHDRADADRDAHGATTAQRPQLGGALVERERSGAAHWHRLAFDVQ